MKLLTKTSLYFLTVSLFVLFAGSIGFYIATTHVIDRKVNKELLSQMHQIMFRFDKVDSIVPNSLILGEFSDIREVNKNENKISDFKDTLLFNTFTHAYEPYREILFYYEKNSKKYEIVLHKSLIQSNDLIIQITLLTFGLVIVLILGIFFLNKYWFNKIWAGFFDTIHKLELFEINPKTQVKFEETYIQEFSQLNHVLEKMLVQIGEDFRGMKEFTENISHEIQTPLAIIKAKTDIQLQAENLTEEQANLILEVQSAASRLSSFNQSLILLAKIENRQFSKIEDVELHTKLKVQLEFFEELIEMNEIELIRDIQPVIVKMDPNLPDIMLINLIKNAIFHNLNKGKIVVTLNSKTLQISNSGDKPLVEPDKLFQRYLKSYQNSENLGIGLSIVKKICDYYNMPIQYYYSENLHHIKITLEE